jgi:hypothetical protein
MISQSKAIVVSRPPTPLAVGFTIAVGKLFLGLLLAAGTAGSVQAQNILASGQLSAVAGGGGTWDYTMIISDSPSATSAIGSFWYAWIPGQFYLPTSPSSASGPTGWTANIVPSGGASSIQFVASSSSYDINPGSSMTFQFVSTDTPATLAGDAAPTYPTTPIGTTVAYGAGLFSSPSETFVVNSVPEPSTLALAVAGCFGLWVWVAGRRSRAGAR